MKKILCPTDFSDSAHGAIAYAGKLSKATGCSLTLLHVKSVFDSPLAKVINPGVHRTIEIKNHLEAQCKEVGRTFRISCDSEVVSKVGKLSTLINKVAKNYDLIVMGSNGAEDLYQFFSGSNTYNAITKSNTPLLLIPQGYTYCDIKTMVYAYDYLRERNLPVARLVPFLKNTDCKLTVLQVMEEAYSKEAEDDLNELQLIIRDSIGDLDYEYATIRSSDIGQSVNNYILNTQPDALALCSVHRNLIGSIFHKSIIKEISAASTYPVYVFPE